MATVTRPASAIFASLRLDHDSNAAPAEGETSRSAPKGDPDRRIDRAAPRRNRRPVKVARRLLGESSAGARSGLTTSLALTYRFFFRRLEFAQTGNHLIVALRSLAAPLLGLLHYFLPRLPSALPNLRTTPRAALSSEWPRVVRLCPATRSRLRTRTDVSWISVARGSLRLTAFAEPRRCGHPIASSAEGLSHCAHSSAG